MIRCKREAQNQKDSTKIYRLFFNLDNRPQVATIPKNTWSNLCASSLHGSKFKRCSAENEKSKAMADIINCSSKDLI